MPPEALPLAGGIGLLRLLAHAGGNKTRDTAYAQSLRQAIARFKAQHVCRFIVDLRFDAGGNMAPMLDGLRALLEPRPYGYWLDADGGKAPWADIGASYLPADATPPLTGAPVAVLIGEGTASAGEFTAIAFEGRADTRLFGAPSAGLVSGNVGYPLPDGAELLISEVFGTDRTGRPWRAAIAPDEATETGQPTLDAAITWLKGQRCR